MVFLPVRKVGKHFPKKVSYSFVLLNCNCYFFSAGVFTFVSVVSGSLKDTQDSGLGLSQQSQGSSDDSTEPKCGCCLERPVDSIFLHGEIAHQIYCYKCSQRVWKERKRCPCCNRTCKVVKVYRTAAFGGKLWTSMLCFLHNIDFHVANRQ